jgi:hypothetical protein
MDQISPGKEIRPNGQSARSGNEAGVSSHGGCMMATVAVAGKGCGGVGAVGLGGVQEQSEEVIGQVVVRLHVLEMRRHQGRRLDRCLGH